MSAAHKLLVQHNLNKNTYIELPKTVKETQMSQILHTRNLVSLAI